MNDVAEIFNFQICATLTHVMDMELVYNQIYNTIVLVSLGTMAPTVLQVNKKGKKIKQKD